MEVECAPGATAAALGECAVRLREGLGVANARLAAVRRALGLPVAPAR